MFKKESLIIPFLNKLLSLILPPPFYINISLLICEYNIYYYNFVCQNKLLMAFQLENSFPQSNVMDLKIFLGIHWNQLFKAYSTSWASK